MFNFNPLPNKSIVEFTHEYFNEVGPCRLWLPEAVNTDRGCAGVYPEGMSWHKNGSILVQNADTKQVFNLSQNVHEIKPGILECLGIVMLKEKPLPWRASYRFGDDRVDFSLSVYNPHNETLPKVSAAVCFKFMKAGWWSDSVCFLLTADGIRSISQLGRTGTAKAAKAGHRSVFQAWLLENETYDNPFTTQFWGYSKTRAAAPVWVSRCDKAGCSVVVVCKDAYYVHSNASNPCTDLALKFGDLEAGVSAVCSGYIQFTTKTARQVFKEL